MSSTEELEKMIDRAGRILQITNSPGANIINGNDNVVVNLANIELGSPATNTISEIVKDIETFKIELEKVKEKIPDGDDVVKDVDRVLKEIKKTTPNWETIIALLKNVAIVAKKFGSLVPWVSGALKKIFELLQPYIPV